MAKKEFNFYGKTLEEVKGLSITEFAALLPSRERRSLTRGRPEDQEKTIEKLKTKNRVKTHCRDLIITPDLLGKTIEIHNGKSWTRLEIEPAHLGHRLGEFALTRKRIAHSSPGVGATRSSSALSVR